MDVREHYRGGPFGIARLQRTHDLEVMARAALEVLGRVHLEGAHHERRFDQRRECAREAGAGGSLLQAAVELVKKVGGEVMGAAFVIELVFLNGRAKLRPVEVFSLLTY